MTGKRQRHSAEFKARVALEVWRGELTVSQLATQHGMHQALIGDWERQAMDGLAAAFSGKADAKDGTPAHDHLGDILATLDADQFQSGFVAWVAAVAGVPAAVIAIDGKTVRRSDQKTGKAAIHMASAFAARQRLVLGQVKVAEKSNEIVAIPELLDMLAVEGAIITIDAMGCQRDIAQTVIDKKADDVLALKGNQGALRQDVELFATEQKTRGFADTEVSQDTTIDGDHGRIETRTTTVIHDVKWLQDRHAWPGLKSVVIVESRREISGKTEQETRYYVTSLVMLASLLGPVVRSH